MEVTAEFIVEHFLWDNGWIFSNVQFCFCQHINLVLIYHFRLYFKFLTTVLLAAHQVTKRNTKFMNPPQCLSASKSNDIAYGWKPTYIFWDSLADQIHTIYKAVRMDVIIKAQTFFTSID